MPRPPSVDRDDVHAWLHEHPGATVPDLRKAFPRMAESTARRWVKDGVPSDYTPRGAAPVDTLASDDRERLVRMVRGLYHAIDLYQQGLVVGGRLNKPDRDTSAAALNWQKTAAGLIESHPGLLELVKGPEGEGATDGQLADLAAGLRGPAPT